MPPQLALIICTIFVLFLLHLERKQSPDVSFALWIPTIWMLLNASKPLGIWFGYGDPSMEAGSPLDRAVLTSLFCFALIILAKRHFNWLTSIKKYPWVFLIIGYMLISILWSDIPYQSFKRVVRVIIAISMAFLIATETEPCMALKCLFRRIIYVHIPFSLILIKYYPHLGVLYATWSGTTMWQGASQHKNGLSLFCMFAIYFLGWTLMQRWRSLDNPVVWYQTYVQIFLLALTIYLFMGAQHRLVNSATSLSALVCGLTVSIALIFQKKRNTLIISNKLMFIMLCIIIFGTVTPFIGKLPLFDFSSILGRDETITGRTNIWAKIIPFAMQKPIWGHGFGGFWTTTMREKIAISTHNGYLDIIIDIGFVGHILFSIFLLSCCRKAQKTLAHDYAWGCFWISCLIMVVIHNTAESSFTSFSSFLGSVLLLILIASTSDILTHRKVIQAS